MFDEFNNLISAYDGTNEEKELDFYEFMYESFFDMLDKFSDDDWMKLIKSLSTRSNVILNKIAFCMRNANNNYNKMVLVNLIDIGDATVFTSVIYSLNACDYNLEEEAINKIIKKIDILMPNAPSWDQEAFNCFKTKFCRNK